MEQDLLSLFIWWVTLFSIGLFFLPLTFIFFKNFFDFGYSFSKVLGILILSFTAFLLPSLKIAPFGNTLIIISLIFFISLNLILFLKLKLLNFFKSRLKIFAALELTFLVALIIWSFVRGFEPSIYGLEKYMDFGFINSILRSEYFPPQDIWLPPHSINYYYFGHLTVAILIKISQVSPFLGYNLMVATLFALTLTCTFSLAANLAKLSGVSKGYYYLAGTISAFLVTLAGNLHTIYAFFLGYNPDNPVPFWQLTLNLNLDSYWYPNATRFIPNTIHEFPLYSFIVSDLHGHVLNIPFVLLFLAILVNFLFQKREENILDYLIFGFLIGIFLITNILDGPIYLLLVTLVIPFQSSYLIYQKINFEHLLFKFSKSLLFISLIAIFFSLPFWLEFKPFGSGIGVMCAPNFLTNIGKIGPLLFEVDHCSRSPLWMLAILWGFYLTLSLIFILKVKEKIPIFLILFALILIIIPEFIYVKDIYPAHYRANTIFKFGFQAFIILGIISGYLFTQLIYLKKLSFGAVMLIWYLFIFVAIYPIFALNSYYGNFKNFQGFNGLNYLNSKYPGDFTAIQFLQKTTSTQPVILEAAGDSYTDYTRISANTGLPTVVGWPVHEWLWRGNPDESFKRVDDVKLLYESDDLSKTSELINKYKIQLIYIGALERKKYQDLNEEKFNSLGKVIFSQDETKIFEVTQSFSNVSN